MIKMTHMINILHQSLYIKIGYITTLKKKSKKSQGQFAPTFSLYPAPQKGVVFKGF